ncbi:MAG: hypothetical protein Q4B52_07340 [Tissierellia bacterium]|nr:hypothetical protein [Tissierellia bacterium]
MRKLKISALLIAATMLFAGCQSNDTAKKDSDSAKNGQQTIYLRRGIKAAHGDNSFASIGVITDGEKIYDVSIDEYQYSEDPDAVKPVPSTDGEFGEGSDNVLFSKLENDAYYSELMKEHGQSTKTVKDNYKAIEEYAKSMSIEDLEQEIEEKGDKIVDAVSEATLVDTKGYLEAIVFAAKNDKGEVEAKANDKSQIKLKRSLSAPHGDKTFAEIFVAVEDDVIGAASIDEYQYFDGEGVANSDKAFGENYKQAPLSSKLRNNDAYSKLMKEHGEATKTMAENFADIQNYVAGKKVSDLENEIKNKSEDAITSATLVDEVGYLQSIVDCANAK